MIPARHAAQIDIGIEPSQVASCRRKAGGGTIILALAQERVWKRIRSWLGARDSRARDSALGARSSGLGARVCSRLRVPLLAPVVIIDTGCEASRNQPPSHKGTEALVAAPQSGGAGIRPALHAARVDRILDCASPAKIQISVPLCLLCCGWLLAPSQECVSPRPPRLRSDW